MSGFILSFFKKKCKIIAKNLQIRDFFCIFAARKNANI